MADSQTKSAGKDKVSDTHSLINIAQIKDGVIILKSGKLCQILSVSTINYDLKSEEEQNAVIYQYQSFLNSLEFPLQIVMQSRKLDLTPYLGTLGERMKSEKNPLLQIQIADYIDFINKLISLVNIMDKEFYVIVPLTPTPSGAKQVVEDIIPGIHFKESKAGQQAIAKFESLKQELGQRVGVITSGLSSMGLHSQPLDDKAIIKLINSIYNPRPNQINSMVESSGK